MECEVCGSPEAPYMTVIEGAKLHTCRNCSFMGKVYSAPSSARREAGAHGGAYGAPRSSKPEYELVEGYGQIIMSARLKMRLPLAVVAEKLAEKESFLERIEHEKAKPTEEVARKIEKELGVKILELTGQGNENVNAEGQRSKFKGPLTLGDLLEIEQRKKKEK